MEIINLSGKRIISPLFIKSRVRRIFKELRKRKIKIPSEQINLVFVSMDEMKRLNRKYRSRNKATDVLSFPGSSPGLFPDSFPHKKKELGDLVLCTAYIKKMKQGPVRERTAYAVLHGILHLLGFEHEKSKRKAAQMYRIQDDIFEKLF